MIMESRNLSLFEDVFSCKSREEPSSSKRVLETINEDQDKDNEVNLDAVKNQGQKNLLVRIF